MDGSGWHVRGRDHGDAIAVGYDANGLHELFSFDFSKLDDRGGPFGLGVIANYFHHGITRSKALTKWIESPLENAPIKKGGKAPKTFGDLDCSLQVVGADVVHARMVVFPLDVARYLDEHGKPYVPKDFPIATRGAHQRGLSGVLSSCLTEVRGDRHGRRARGRRDDVRLRGVRVRPAAAEAAHLGFPAIRRPSTREATEQPDRRALWPVDMVSDVIDTAIHALDDFELKHFGDRVIAIPTGSVSMLNFSLSEHEKAFPYQSGYDTVRKFFDRHPRPTNRFRATPRAETVTPSAATGHTEEEPLQQ